MRGGEGGYCYETRLALDGLVEGCVTLLVHSMSYLSLLVNCKYIHRS